MANKKKGDRGKSTSSGKKKMSGGKHASVKKRVKSKPKSTSRAKAKSTPVPNNANKKSLPNKGNKKQAKTKSGSKPSRVKLKIILGVVAILILLGLFTLYYLENVFYAVDNDYEKGIVDSFAALPYLNSVTPDENFEMVSLINSSDSMDAQFLLVGNRAFSQNGSLIHAFDGVSFMTPLGDFQFVMYKNGRLVVEDIFGTEVQSWSVGLHHELELSLDKTKAYFYTRSVPRSSDGGYELYEGRIVSFDSMVEFDLHTGLIRKWSTWDNHQDLKNHHPPSVLDSTRNLTFNESQRERLNFAPGFQNHYDYYHANSIFVIPENPNSRDSRFQPGNLLISLRNVNTIFILDKDTFQIVWNYTGELDSQHSPILLSNGNILVLDNGYSRGFSRIVEINPLTDEIVWTYEEDGFYTRIRGHLQELPNGNILVSESMKNRVFEITKEKELVYDIFLKVKSKNNIYRAELYPVSMIQGVIK